MSVVFDVGDSPQLEYRTYDGDVLMDATTVTLTVVAPDGTVTTPAVAHAGIGVYQANVSVDQVGTWTFLWVAAGAVIDQESGGFRVQAGATGRDYASLGELQEWLGDESQRHDTGQLRRVLSSVSRAVDKHCGRRFWRDNAATTKVFRAEEPTLVWTGDIWTTTGLVVRTDPGGTGTWSQTWSAGEYQLEPLNADQDAGSAGAYAWWQLGAVGNRVFPLHQRAPGVQVTARWGWSAVPDQVVEATLLKAASLFKRRDAPFGFAELGDNLAVVRISRNDPDVVQLLKPFKHFRPRTLSYDPQARSLFHGGRR